MSGQQADCHTAPLPARSSLSADQSMGRACVTCGTPLSTGAVPRGAIGTRSGEHDTSVQVWACPPGGAR